MDYIATHIAHSELCHLSPCPG